MIALDDEKVEQAIKELVYHRTLGESGSGYMPRGELNRHLDNARRHMTEVLKAIQPALEAECDQAKAQALAEVREALELDLRCALVALRDGVKGETERDAAIRIGGKRHLEIALSTLEGTQGEGT